MYRRSFARCAAQVAAVVLLIGCATGENDDGPWLQLPQFISVTGPTGTVSDVDYKPSTALIDFGTVTSATAFFRYAGSAAELESTAATELTPDCDAPSANSTCSTHIPDRFSCGSVGGPIFSDGSTVFYQWFLGYSLPGGSDEAYVRSDVFSFTVTAPSSCVDSSDCAGGASCVQDHVNATPDSELFPLVCRSGTGTGVDNCPSPPPCPVGFNGQVCNGDGTCINGSCSCNPDYSGSACETVCQRCYGANGNNCGRADAPTNFGFCAPDDDGDGNVVCDINVGSWTHDECCIRFRVNGPSTVQGSCAGGITPPEVCAEEFGMAANHLTVHTYLTWQREVPKDVAACISDEDVLLPVDHAQYCNQSGGQILCEHADFCCSRAATPLQNQPLLAPGEVCTCD